MTEKETQLATLGKRMERLFIAAIFFSIGSCALLILTASHQTQTRDKVAHLRFTAKAIEAHLKERTDLFTYATNPATCPQSRKKSLALYQATLIEDAEMEHTDGEADGVHETLRLLGPVSPGEIVSRLNNDADIFEKAPLTVIGITVTPSIDLTAIGGLKFTVQMETVKTFLQFLLAPAMFLWLGSTYVTRQREILLLLNGADVDESYPHLLNNFPVARQRYAPRSRRRPRNSWIPRFLKNEQWFAFMLRLAVLLVLMGPSVGAYIASESAAFLLSGNSGPPPMSLFLLGEAFCAALAAQCAGLIALEFSLVRARKRHLSPEL